MVYKIYFISKIYSTSLGSLVFLLLLAFNIFGFPIFWHWATMVIPETRSCALNQIYTFLLFQSVLSLLRNRYLTRRTVKKYPIPYATCLFLHLTLSDESFPKNAFVRTKSDIYVFIVSKSSTRLRNRYLTRRTVNNDLCVI